LSMAVVGTVAGVVGVLLAAVSNDDASTLGLAVAGLGGAVAGAETLTRLASKSLGTPAVSSIERTGNNLTLTGQGLGGIKHVIIGSDPSARCGAGGGGARTRRRLLRPHREVGAAVGRPASVSHPCPRIAPRAIRHDELVALRGERLGPDQYAGERGQAPGPACGRSTPTTGASSREALRVLSHVCDSAHTRRSARCALMTRPGWKPSSEQTARRRRTGRCLRQPRFRSFIG